MSEMKIALLNTGLLQPVSGAAGSPPLYDCRSEHLEDALRDYLLKQLPDILLLTEIWHRRDFDTISRLAEQCGYSMLEKRFREQPMSSDEPTRTGLVGLVSTARFVALDVACISLCQQDVPLRADIEASFGVTERTTLHALLRDRQGLTTSLYLQHLTPQIHDPLGRIRESQTLRLAEVIAERWLSESPTLLVIAGDFNFSLEHGSSREPYDAAAERQLYHRFIAHTTACGGPALTDAWLAAHEGKPGWTLDHAKNELSRSGASTNEPDRRVDMIFFASRAQNDTPVSVTSCRLIFDKPVAFAGQRSTMLSDHFGLETHFLIGAAAREGSSREKDSDSSDPRAPLIAVPKELGTHADATTALPIRERGSGSRVSRRSVRAPSESLPFLIGIVNDAMARFDLSEPVGVMLIGSVAEGFGNAYSDIDFLVVSQRENPFPMMRHMTTHGDRRCEFFFRTAKQLAEIAEVVKRHPTQEDCDTQASEDFDLYQRVCSGVPLLNAPLVERACAPFNRQVLTQLVSVLEQAAMIEQMSRAWILEEMQAPAEAAIAARRAVLAAAAAFAAKKGQTYRSRKFIFKLLENVEAPQEVTDSLRALLGFSDASSGAYVSECMRLIRALGWTCCPQSLAEFRVEPEGEVSRWDIGAGSTVLLRGEDELFLLSRRGARLWDELTSGGKWNLERVRGEPELLTFVRAVHTAGLIRLRWCDSGRAWSTPATLRHVKAVPLLTSALNTDGAQDDVAKYSSSAREVVGAVMNFLTFANYVENDREDAIGAASKGDWDLLADSLRRQVLHTCIARLSVDGVYPIDVNKDDSYESILQLDRVHKTQGYGERALRLLSLEPATRAAAIAAYESVGAFTEDVLGAFLSDDQRQAYSSAVAWYRTLKLGTEWAMLANRLGLALPLEELSTLVSVALGEQTLLIKPHSIVQQLSWKRTLDFVRELDKRPVAAAESGDGGYGM